MSEQRVSGTARAQVPARFLDLSLGGALLSIQTTLRVGAIHDFGLDLSGETLWVQGEVRHCRLGRPGAGYEVGVQFVGIDPKDERRLRNYLTQRK